MTTTAAATMTSSQAPHAATSVPRIAYTTTLEIPIASSLQEFRHLCQQNRPVAYKIPLATTNMKDDPATVMPALEKWTPDLFGSSSLPIGVRHCSSGRFFDLVHSSVWQLATTALTHPMTLGKFVQQLQSHLQCQRHSFSIISGTDLYLRHEYVNREHPFLQELLSDMGYGNNNQLEQFFHVPWEHVRTIGLWISGGAKDSQQQNCVSSQTHFDRCGDHNLNFQIQGTKLFTLYAPEDGRDHLYPLLGRMSNISLVDPYSSEDVLRFPRVAHSRPYVIQLPAGHVLHIPAGWWHDVRHLGDWNVNVTAWFIEGGGPIRNAWKGSWFGSPTTAWGDLVVAWFYMAKLIVVLLVVVCLKLWDTLLQQPSRTYNALLGKHVRTTANHRTGKEL